MKKDEKQTTLYLNPLKPNGAKKYPKRVIAIDTEDNSAGETILCTLYEEKKITTLRGQLRITEYMYSFLNRHKDESIDFFAHNMLYDMVNLFGAENLLNDFELFFTKTNFVFARYKPSKNILFRDSYYLFPMKLKKIGEIIGLEKIETDDFQDEKYNARDAEIVYKAVTGYIDVLKNNEMDFAFTNGGIALKTFRRYYQKESFFFPLKDIELIRNAYYGGRTENFVVGIRENVNVYDVNSLYPFCMMNDFPDVRSYVHTKEITKLGIYHVKAKVKKTTQFPLLPHRTKDKRLIFPVGEFETYCTGAELIAAESEIEKITVIDGVAFANAGKIFEKFVQNYYKMRLLSKNELYKTVWKNVLNSLYGKFAQDNHRIKYNDEKKQFEQIETDYPNNSLFPWSIFVTAYGRIYMHEQIKNFDSREIFYMDTDSIHTSKKFPTGTKLGHLKFEGNFTANYQAAKQYFLLDNLEKKEYYKCKGIPLAKGVNPNRHRQEFFAGKTEIKRPVKLRESLRRKMLCNLWIEFEKVNHLPVQKRKFDSKGNSKPLEI